MESFNYSAIATYRRCNKLFQYVYVDRLKSDVSPSGDMAWGTAVHLGAEAYLLGDDGLEDFLTYWDIERTRNNRYGRFSWGELREQGINLLTKFNKYHLKKFEIFQMEQRLYGSFQGINLEGTPDVIGKFEGVESVLDFKTTGSPYHKDKIRTAEQLFLYAHLAQQCLNYPVKQIVYLPFVKGTSPSIQKPLIHKVSLEELELVLLNLKAECKRVLTSQENNSFTRNPANCIMGTIQCDMWNKCYKGKEE